MRTIKLVIIGDSGVGKTSIRSQYISGRFSTGYRATIGTDFITKTLPHHSKPDESVMLQIWDTAGQERFSSLSAAFFRGADAALLMFDVNRPETLDGLHKWWGEFKDRAPVSDEEAEDYCCVVVGNKIDLTEETDSREEEDGPRKMLGVKPNLKVTESDALNFLEELVPPSSPPRSTPNYDDDEDAFFNQPRAPNVPANGTPSNIDLHSPYNHGAEQQSEPPARSQSITINGRHSSSPSSQHPYAQHHQRVSKSRSTERSSQFGGTMTTARTTLTIYHTPSSSFYDAYHSPPSSSFVSSPPPPPGIDLAGRLERTASLPTATSPPLRQVRRMTSASTSTTSSAPTITPSLFTRGQASTSTTPPTPSHSPPQPHTSLPPESEITASRAPPAPERRPKLFFTSAKTGDNVTSAFEYIAARVVQRWEYEEALEARTMHMRDANASWDADTVRLGVSSSDLRSRAHLQVGKCCGS